MHPSQLGRYGVWSRELVSAPPDEAAEAAATLEELGFGAAWAPGGRGAGKEALEALGRVLAATTRLVVATGIVNIFGVAAADLALTARALDEAHGGRFVLGVGVGHREAGAGSALDGSPIRAMAQYLDALDAAGVSRQARAVAALGDAMLRLAGERSLGAHPYLATPAHTAHARAVLGPGPLLAPEQPVVLETDPEKARAIARTHLATYLGLGNYVRNWRRLGFGAGDVEGAGSDDLVDGIVAWGTDDAVASRLRAHLEAGADHVCVQVLAPVGATPVAEWTRLAAVLAPRGQD